MHLSLVSTSPPQASEFLAEPIELGRQPWRPGELCLVIDLQLPIELRERLDRAAAEQGVPVAVVMQAAVEAERVIAILSGSPGRTRNLVVALLDDAAGATLERGVDPPATRRLRAYALAVLAAGHAPTVPTPTHLAIRVPQSLAAAWSLAAAAETSPLEHWIVKTLEHSDLTRTRWEAAAAYAGRALEGWAAVALLAYR